MKRTGWLGTGRSAQLRQMCTDLLRPGSNPEDEKPTGQFTNSPLFTSLIERLRTLGYCTVLDLGPALGSNVAFFGDMHCRIQIADCATALLALNAREEDGPDSYKAELEKLLPLTDLQTCDVILTWDLLNYLNKSLFRALMTHLSPVVSGDTWLHGYIGSRRVMSAAPQLYRLNREGRVEVTASTRETQDCPCYSQPELRMLMPRFGVSRSTLLQSGMQEYLFQGQGRGHRQSGR